MSKRIKWRLIVILCILVISSLACEFTMQFTEWFRDFSSDEEEEKDHYEMCNYSIVLLDDYTITCDDSTNPKTESFSARIINNSDYYAHNVSIEVLFSPGYPMPSCSFDYGEIPPGGSVEALCHFKSQKCGSALASVSAERCDLMSYPEHLDWLAEKDKKAPQETNPEQKDSFILTQTHVDLLHDSYKQSFVDNPCDPEAAKKTFLNKLQAQANIWSDEAGEIIGDGKQFSDFNSFIGWLTANAKVDEISPINKIWSSDIELGITPLVSCFACTPPILTGTLNLTVDLTTCQVTGKLIAEGEGNVTINDCVDNMPIEDTCTSHGKLSISGDVSGTTSKSGELNLNPTSTKFVYSSQWIDGCDWDTQDVKNSNWEEPITISGSLEWKGSASGKIHWASSACTMDGNWTAHQK